MRHQWIIPPLKKVAVKELPGFGLLKSELLHQRGITTLEEAEKFLHPVYDRDLHDPLGLRQMKVAVMRIVQAIRDNEAIAIYADYDADGVCAAAVLFNFFQAIGRSIQVYIPERRQEGYGLNIPALEQLAGSGVKLVITVDCGSTSIKEIARAHELEMDVIVTDHHEQPEVLPDAFAIINPIFSDEIYPCRNLSAAGVVFKLVQALIKQLDRGRGIAGLTEVPEDWEKWLLDLVAIATIADMVPLLDENRSLVYFGLKVLQHTRRPGLRALAAYIKTPIPEFDEDTVAFQIGPRLNAAGRLEHANTAFQLLVTNDEQEAMRLAQELERINVERQRLTEVVTKEAVAQAQEQKDDPGIVVFGTHWPTGILGLAAGRLAQTMHRPTLVMSDADGEIVGSGRSVPGLNIIEVLRTIRGYCSKLGGHEQACGCTLAEDVTPQEFAKKFKEAVKKSSDQSKQKSSREVSMRLGLNDLTRDFVDFIEQLRPFGQGNRAPVFLLPQIAVQQAWAVGRRSDHLRAVFSDGTGRTQRSIGFSLASELERLKPGIRLDAFIQVELNFWQGRHEIDAKIIDLRHQDEIDAAA